MSILKPKISYDEFSKIDIRLGTIISVEPVEKSDKLLKLIVDFGTDIGKRQILSGIAKSVEIKDLLNKQTTFVLNLESKKIMGIESEGMLLAIDDKNNNTILFSTTYPVDNGESAC